MKMHLSLPELAKARTYSRIQRALLAVCIALFPLALALYAFSWPINPLPIVESTQAGTTGNVLHFLAAFATSLFLPLGYLGMALLGIKRAPTLARWAAALGLIGWIPWSAMMAIDDLAFQVALTGNSPANAALWTRFNGDPVMLIYLIWYALGHLVSTVLIAYLLGKVRLIPRWTAWSFALTAPLTIAYFITHVISLKYVFAVLIGAGLLIGALPAAYAMFTGKDQEEPEKHLS